MQWMYSLRGIPNLCIMHINICTNDIMCRLYNNCNIAYFISCMIIIHINSPVTPHSGRIVPNDVSINIFATHCHGDEATLTSCEHEVSRLRCNHSLDVVLTCRGWLIYIFFIFYYLLFSSI